MKILFIHFPFFHFFFSNQISCYISTSYQDCITLWSSPHSHIHHTFFIPPVDYNKEKLKEDYSLKNLTLISGLIVNTTILTFKMLTKTQNSIFNFLPSPELLFNVISMIWIYIASIVLKDIHLWLVFFVCQRTSL